MPKLLQINATANWGSTGRIAEQIGLAAMASGWESYIAYGRNHNSSESNLIRIGSSIGVGLHVIKARLFDAAGLGSSRATKRLIRQIERIRPDVVQLHNIHGYYLNYKLLFEYLNGTDIKVVWTFHDFWAITGHCAHFVEAGCEKWQNRCYACPLYKRYPSSLRDGSQRNYLWKKSCFSGCNNLQIVSLSDWGKQCIMLSYLADKSISVIPNGVNLTTFSNRKVSEDMPPKDKRFVILGVATQWKEGKGLEDYLQLSRMLKDDEIIVMVGVTRKQKQLLPSNVIGYETISSQMELSQIYSQADVLISLSYAETFGMTIVEAAACGTPSVVYDNTAQKSLVTKDTGELVPTGDVEAVYNAIQIVRRYGKEHYREACRARAERLFDKDKCFEKYISLYESLLADKN